MKNPKSPIGMADIARLAGVSRPTVSRALGDSPLVNQETKDRIKEIAQRHGFIINRSAQNLRRKQTNTVAVIIDFPALPEERISDPFHFELLGNISNALANHGQDILLCSTQSAHSVPLGQLMAHKGVDGIIFIGQSGAKGELKSLAEQGAPFVVWGAQTADAKYCVVGSDNPRGGQLVAKRFQSMGRKFALFIGPRGHEEIEMRLNGFADAWEGRFEKLAIHDLSFQSSREALKNWLDKSTMPPDAIFAGSDTMAMGALAALKDAGLAVPKDCTVCGYDDSPAAIYHSPALTTVKQDTAEAASLLVDRLMKQVEGNPQPGALLKTEIIIRDT